MLKVFKPRSPILQGLWGYGMSRSRGPYLQHHLEGKSQLRPLWSVVLDVQGAQHAQQMVWPNYTTEDHYLQAFLAQSRPLRLEPRLLSDPWSIYFWSLRVTCWEPRNQKRKNVWRFPGCMASLGFEAGCSRGPRHHMNIRI